MDLNVNIKILNFWKKTEDHEFGLSKISYEAKPIKYFNTVKWTSSN